MNKDILMEADVDANIRFENIFLKSGHNFLSLYDNHLCHECQRAFVGEK